MLSSKRPVSAPVTVEGGEKMASFDVSGDLSEMVSNLEKLNLFDDATQKEVLTGCGDILTRKIKELFTGDWETTETFRHVVCKPRIQRDRNGVPYVTVTVDGKRSDGQRYGTIAFVLNYGRREEYGHIEGSHFWNRAVEVTEKEMQQLIEEITNERIQKSGLA